MLAFDELLFDTKASGDDDFAILRERLADRVERLLDRGIDEAAGVDDDEIRAGVIRRGGVALGAQLREDALGIDERFGTSQAYETNLRTDLTTCRDRFCLCYQRGNRGRIGR